MKIILSLIIPVYNTEKYLKRCLDSCIVALEKTGMPVEFVIVNDGSPDNAQTIIEEYSNKYSFIKYIIQENKGLSSARNIGVENAKGKYIWFIDSDDTITSNSISILENYFCDTENSEFDLFYFNYNLLFDDGKYIAKEKNLGANSGIELLYTRNQAMGAPFYIFNRDFLIKNNLFFLTGVYHEDNEFNFRMLFLAKKIKFIPYYMYNYYIYNMRSITSTPSLKRSIDLLLIAKSIYSFMKENVELEHIKTLSYYVGLCLSSAYNNIKRCSHKDKFFFYHELKKYSNILFFILHKSICKYKILVIICCLNIIYYGQYKKNVFGSSDI